MSRKIDLAQCQVYFDRMSRAMDGRQAELEVASLDLGDQIEAEWIPLNGITYDKKDDLFEIALENVDHLIRQPREVWVDELGLMLQSLEVVDRDGVRHILKLRLPLMLPPPEGAGASFDARR
jgi:hypothetical protein